MIDSRALDALDEVVDGLTEPLLAATGEIVAIPSVSPRYPGVEYGDHVGGEGRVAAFMQDLYAQIGCDVDLFALEPGRENCVGVLRGRSHGRSLIFNGHMDVVPPGPADEWHGGDPWSGALRDGRIWGRGACDMKGGIVAQAYAAMALKELGIQLAGDLILEAVVGEEMMEHELGTTACLKRGYRADAAIVSEPSAPPAPLAVVPVTPGLLQFRVTVSGKATHPSMRGETIHAGGYGAEVGVNAIDKLFLVYESLRRLEEEWGLTKRHPLFRPGHFAIHPGVVVGAPRSGLVPFVIADSAYLDYLIWQHPDEDADDVRAEIERHIQATASLDGWLREHPPQVEWVHEWPKSVVDPSHPIVEALCSAHERATGEQATVAGFAAVEDTTWLNRGGITSVSYGPGDIRVAHAVDEYVEVSELIAATKTYALVAAAWCGA